MNNIALLCVYRIVRIAPDDYFGNEIPLKSLTQYDHIILALYYSTTTIYHYL